MRKTVLLLLFLLVVAAAGLLLAGAGAGPAVGAGLGITVVGAFAVMRIPTDRLLWFTSCLFVLTVTWNGIRLGGGAFGNMFMALAFASLIAHCAVTRTSPPLPPWLLAAGSGLLLAQVVTLVFPPSVELTNQSQLQFKSLFLTPVYIPPRSDIVGLLKYEASILLVPMLMMSAGLTRRRCARLLDLFAISALCSALVGIVDYSGFQIGPTPLTDSRASGLAIHPNYLALGCSMAIPLVLLWLTRPRLRWRLAAVVALVLLLGGVLTSGSREGAATAVTGLAGTVVLIPWLRRRLPLVLPYVGMAAVVVLFFTNVGQHVLDKVRLTGGASVTGSDYARKYAADVAFHQIRARPISGVGFSVIADAHDIYLEILAAGGIIALTSFVVFVAGLAMSAFRGFRGPQRDETAVAGLAVALWLVGSIVGNELADKFLYVVPGILMALARVGAVGPVRRRPSETVVEVAGRPPSVAEGPRRTPEPALA